MIIKFLIKFYSFFFFWMNQNEANLNFFHLHFKQSSFKPTILVKLNVEFIYNLVLHQIDEKAVDHPSKRYSLIAFSFFNTLFDFFISLMFWLQLISFM